MGSNRHSSEQRQETMRNSESSSSTRPDKANAGKNREVAPIDHLQRTIGNQAVQRLLQAKVQESQGVFAKSDHIKSVASEGINTAGTQLPHLEKIQASFGKHDVTNVQAHSATEANEMLGTKAYAMGNHVAFGQSPSLSVAAHEAAHVVQQRAGVQLKEGVGQAGDKYEQHADEVAKEVVAGRSAEGLLDKTVQGGNCFGCVQPQTVQFWGNEDHKKYTGAAVNRWNDKHPRSSKMNISLLTRQCMIEASNDPDRSGRAVDSANGNFSSDSRIYWDYITLGKPRKRLEYKLAGPAKKKEMEAEAAKFVCPSEGPTHGEGERPNYGIGGESVNQAYMLSKIKAASEKASDGEFMTWAAAGQLGDAMHCAQDRGSHWEGNRNKGHDDVEDKLGINDYDTDDPKKNLMGVNKAMELSDKVLEEYAKLRSEKMASKK